MSSLSSLCFAVLKLLDQTGYTRTGEPLSDLHACMQSEGDCYHPSAQGQDPSTAEELSVSPFLLPVPPEQCPFPHWSRVRFKHTFSSTCTDTAERGAGQAGDFLKRVFPPEGLLSELQGTRPL